MHHRIEEAYIFPLLVDKLPQFGPEYHHEGEGEDDHDGDHDGNQVDYEHDHAEAHRLINEGKPRSQSSPLPLHCPTPIIC
jgi:hypothetical protein